MNHERWLVSYADFITLLFAFFVVLFSSSQVDKRKVGKLAAAIQGAFQNLGISQTANYPLRDANLPGHSRGWQNCRSPGRDASGTLPPARPIERFAEATRGRTATGNPAAGSGVESCTAKVWWSACARSDSLTVVRRKFGPPSEATVRRIAEALAAQKNNIRIEGHTDNVPIHNAQFASNWELSTARATEMTRLFVMRYSFPPSRLSAAGYAEFHPVAANSTAEGRATNRRIDIVILASAPGASGRPSNCPASPPPEAQRYALTRNPKSCLVRNFILMMARGLSR